MKTIKIGLICLICLMSLSGNVHAQQLDSMDLRLLRAAQYVDHTYDSRQVTYGFTKGKRTWNPVYHVLSSSMYVYQSVVSPLLMSHCMFIPSCSAYSKALIHEYGMLKGTILTSDRLMRCNRIALSDNNTKYLIIDGHGHIPETVDRYRL